MVGMLIMSIDNRFRENWKFFILASFKIECVHKMTIF